MGCPSPGALHREYRPFWLIGGPLLVRRTCMLACTWSRVRGWIENCKNGWFCVCVCVCVCVRPSACPKLSQANSSALLESLSVRHRGISDLKWHLSRVGIAIAGAYTGRTSEADLCPQLENHSLGTNTCLVLTPALLVPALLSSGGKGAGLGDGEHTFKGKPQLTPGSSPRLSIFSTISYQGDSCQYTLRKTWLVFTSYPALPPKPLDICRLYRDTST